MLCQGIPLAPYLCGLNEGHPDAHAHTGHDDLKDSMPRIPGQRMSTHSDIASALGVTQSTVSRALDPAQQH